MKRIYVFLVLLASSFACAQEQMFGPENKPVLVIPTATVEQTIPDMQHFKTTVPFEQFDSFARLIKDMALENIAPGNTALKSDESKANVQQAFKSFGFKEQDFILRQYEGDGGFNALDMVLLGTQAKLRTVYHETAHIFHNHFLIRQLTEYGLSFITQLNFLKGITTSLFSGLSCKEKSKIVVYSIMAMGVAYFMLNYILYPKLSKAQEYQADRSAVEHLLADGKIDVLLPDLLVQKKQLDSYTMSRFDKIIQGLIEALQNIQYIQYWRYETHPEWTERWEAMKRTVELMGYDIDKELERYEKELALSKSNSGKSVASVQIEQHG